MERAVGAGGCAKRKQNRQRLRIAATGGSIVFVESYQWAENAKRIAIPMLSSP